MNIQHSIIEVIEERRLKYSDISRGWEVTEIHKLYRSGIQREGGEIGNLGNRGWMG